MGVEDVVTANVSVVTTEDGLFDQSSQFVAMAVGETVFVMVTVVVTASEQAGRFQSSHLDDVGCGELLVVTAKVMVGKEVIVCDVCQSSQSDMIWREEALVVTANVTVATEVEVLKDCQSCHRGFTDVCVVFVVRAKVTVGGVNEEESIHGDQVKSSVVKVLVVTANSIVGKVDDLGSFQRTQSFERPSRGDEVIRGIVVDGLVTGVGV